MKIVVDNETRDYIEVKENFKKGIDLSIRARNLDKSSIIITANLNQEQLDKLITQLVILKSKIALDE